MPLKLKRRGAVWYVRGTVAGKSIFESAGTSERPRAEAFRAKREKELWDRSVYGERATVTFAEAVESYLAYTSVGVNDRRHIDRLVRHFATMPLARIDQRAVDLAIPKLLPGVQPGTIVRALITPLTAILTHAAARQWCDAPRFQRPAQPRQATHWLTVPQARAFLGAAPPHLYRLALFVLCTGARLAEALELDWADVHLADRYAMLRDTKNGRDRKAGLPDAAVAMLARLGHREGRVFRRPDGEPYADRERVGGGQIKTVWGTTCEAAGLVAAALPGDTLPANRLHGPRCRIAYQPLITPHDLRHTWATWFYGVTKDLLLLKAEGDWSSVAMVERYAHLMKAEDAPDVHTVWGASHPRIGALPIRAQSVHRGALLA
jgi:integrase